MVHVTIALRPGTLTRRAFLGTVSLLTQAGCGQEVIAVGGARFRVVKKGDASRRYIHIHGNETTAREVLGEHMRTHEGVALFVEGDNRMVRTEGLELDPNRMFSRAGAEANLKRLNPGVNEVSIEKAVRRIERDLPAFLKVLLPPPGGLIIAIHNNSQGYNIQDEIPISDAHHLPKPDAPNDFFLATNEADFEVLGRSSYNAVLQVKAPPTDDGSLSRLCAARGIRYVNLECYLGREETQREMLAWLDSALL